MKLVDRAKTMLSAVSERLMPQRVVFHHVPKCGGTSVGRALRKRFILSQATVVPESSFRAFEAFTGRNDRENMLVDVLDLREQMLLYHLFEDVRCVSLHVRFSNTAYDQFHDRYKFVTILRDPVERFVSHYFWSYRKAGAHARIDEDFEAFLETPRARRLGAAYVEYFSGLPKEADVTSPEAISAAIENLRRMDVVGRLDDLDEFRRRMQAELGVRVRIGHENKMRQPASRKTEVMTPALTDRLRALCAPDIEVWEALHG